MTEANFENVMAEVFKHEGGYVNDPRDAGGETNYGISKRAHPTVDIRGLTKKTAGDVYRVDYWNRVKAGAMPDGLDLVLMDGSVNSGIGRGPKWVQKALGVPADGKIGPQTIAAAGVQDSSGIKVIQDACAARMGFLRGLSVWSVYKNGWSRRVASVEAVGVRMWLDAHKHAPTRETLVGLGQEAKTSSDNQKGGAGITATSSVGVGVGGDVVLEPMALIAVVVIAAIAAMVVFGRSRNNANRAKAYEAEVVNLGV